MENFKELNPTPFKLLGLDTQPYTPLNQLDEIDDN